MLFSDRKQAEKDLLRSLKKGFEGKFRIYLRNLKFGRKMAFLEQNRLKTREKCRFRIYLRIYFGCFEVFWLEGKGFFGGNQIP